MPCLDREGWQERQGRWHCLSVILAQKPFLVQSRPPFCELNQKLINVGAADIHDFALAPRRHDVCHHHAAIVGSVIGGQARNVLREVALGEVLYGRAVRRSSRRRADRGLDRPRA